MSLLLQLPPRLLLHPASGFGIENAAPRLVITATSSTIENAAELLRHRQTDTVKSPGFFKPRETHKKAESSFFFLNLLFLKSPP
jgi:hypothetical protein